MTSYTCLSGDFCDKPAVYSTMFPKVKRFCKTHQNQLDTIREEFETKAKPKTHEIFCSVTDCPNRPIYGTKFCFDHTQGDEEEID